MFLVLGEKSAVSVVQREGQVTADILVADDLVLNKREKTLA